MDIGSLTGQVAIEDQFSSVLELIVHRAEAFADNFQGALGGIAVGVGVGVAAISAMTAAVTALAVQGSDINDVKSTFDHFAESVGGAESVLEGLRTGTKGTIDDMVLMRDASRMLSVGVKLNADDFEMLGQAAFVLQNRGLGSTKEMLDLVSTAMVTGRTRALAMKLGVVDVADAEQTYADRLGISKEQMTQTQITEAKRITIMQMLSSAVKDAGDQQLDFGEKIESVEAKIKNWVDELASAVAVSPSVARAFDAVMDAVSDISDYLSTLSGGKSALDTIVGAVNTFADAVTVATPYVKEFLIISIDLVAALWKYRDVLEAAAVSYGVYKVAAGAAAVSNVLFAGSTTTAIGTVGLLAGAFKALDFSSLATAGISLGLLGESAMSAIGPLAALTVGTYLVIEAWKLAHANTGWVRDLSDDVEYLALRVKGYSAEEAKAMIAQDHLTQSQLEQKSVTESATKATAQFTAEQRAEQQAAEAAKATKDAYNKSVQSVVDSVRKANNEVNLSTDAFNKVGSAMRLTIESQQILIPMLDKIIASGRALTQSEADYYSAVTTSNINIRKEGEELLATNKVTLQQIESLKAMGLAETEVAQRLGTTVSALQSYQSELAQLQALQQSNAKAEMAMSGTARDQVVLDNQTKFQNAVDNLNKLSPLYGQTYDALAKQRDLDTEAWGLSWSQKAATSKEALQQTADAEYDAYQRMSTSGLTFSRDVLDAQFQKYLDAKNAVATFGTVAVQSYHDAHSAVLTFGEGLSAMDDGMDASRINVRLLDGEVVSLTQAIARFNAGNTMTYDLSTVEGVENYRRMNTAASISWSDWKIVEFIKAGGTLADLISMGVINPLAAFGPGMSGNLSEAGSNIGSPSGASSPSSPSGGGGSSSSSSSNVSTPVGSTGASTSGVVSPPGVGVGAGGVAGNPAIVQIHVSGIWDPRTTDQMVDLVKKGLTGELGVQLGVG